MDRDGTPVDVLLIEDNLNDIEITKRAIDRGPVKNRLIVARDGEEALARLAQQHGGEPLPSLILLDLNLPKISGHDVLKEIRATPRLRRIPVIALTASTRTEDIAQAYDLGVNFFDTAAAYGNG
ncbi:MAG: response regulator, partial [Dehalococcoidia bacterium]